MRKQIAISISTCLMLLALTMTAVAQEPSSFVAKASGEGTIKIGKEEFKLYSVVVKVFDDGKAEINLITDITVFIQGAWVRGSDNSKGLDLTITGHAMSSNLEGRGKLVLSEDQKSITALNLEVVNMTSKKVIKVTFVGK